MIEWLLVLSLCSALTVPVNAQASPLKVELVSPPHARKAVDRKVNTTDLVPARVTITNVSSNRLAFTTHPYYVRLVVNEGKRQLTNLKDFGPNINWSQISAKDICVLDTGRSVVLNVYIIPPPQYLRHGEYSVAVALYPATRPNLTLHDASQKLLDSHAKLWIGKPIWSQSMKMKL